MKKSKKILLVCISTIMLVVLFFSRESFAATVVLDGISKQYETWSNLSDDEKKNTVVPSLNSQVTSTIDLGKNEDVLPSKYITNNVNVKVGNSQSTYFTNGGIVRDMQDTNECWCFASTSAFSYNLLKNNLTSSFKLFSPRHMDYACSRYGFFGEINWEGYNRDVFTYGNYIMASAYLARGSGPVDEEEFPFENVPAVTNIYPWEMEIAPKYMVKNIDRYNSIYKKYTENGVSYYSDNRLVNELSVSEVNAIRNKIKESIVTNGSIMTYTYTPVRESDLDYYTENFRNFYLPTNPTDTEHVMNHGVLIVGWDDNYSKENFNSKHRPANDGAYICLNCYGTSFGNDGYYYISYDDFYVESDLFVISEVSSIDYDRIYQYDPLGSSVGLPLSDGHNNYTDLKIANVFTKSSDSSKVEKINQMSFFLFDDEEVEVLVNPYNDNLDSCLSQSIGTVSSGYHTVEFSEPIEVKGDKFAVGLRLKNSNGVCLPMEIDPNVFGIDAPAYKYSPFAHAGEGFIKLGNDAWTDFTEAIIFNGEVVSTDANLNIKAFTVESDVPTDINVVSVSVKDSDTLKVNDTVKLIATISPSNATNKNVTWTSSDPTVATVDQNGNVKALKAGTTNIIVKTEDGNKTATCRITVTEESSEIIATSVTLNYNELNLTLGDKTNLIVTVNPSGVTSKNIVWSSGDSSIVTVDSEGAITGLKDGTTTITAKDTVSGLSATCVVKVSSSSNKETNGDNNNNNNNNNNGNSNGSSNGSNSNNGSSSNSSSGSKASSSASSVDNTTAKSNIPQTGESFTIFIIIGSLVIIGVLLRIKYKKNDDID